MLEVYGTKDCARCGQVKQLISKRGIEFKYYDLDDIESEIYYNLIKTENDNLLPLILDDKNVVRLSYVLNKGKQNVL